LQYVANVNYTVPCWSAASLDLAAVHFGSEPATVDNGVYSPAVTTLSLGARYKFTTFSKHSTLRLQIQNATNSYWWTNVYTPGLFQWPGPRTVFAYLTTDL
jgi:outer membrane receptor protein involved in Fe transport